MTDLLSRLPTANAEALEQHGVRPRPRNTQALLAKIAGRVHEILVDEGDVAGMAEAMMRFAGDAGAASAMGRAGHERVRKEFTLRGHVERLWSVVRASLRE